MRERFNSIGRTYMRMSLGIIRTRHWNACAKLSSSTWMRPHRGCRHHDESHVQVRNEPVLRLVTG